MESPGDALWSTAEDPDPFTETTQRERELIDVITLEALLISLFCVSSLLSIPPNIFGREEVHCRR